MRLTHEDKSSILNRLPYLKLSYETTHNKVFSDMYYLIPYGKKHLLWFTYFEDKRVCLLVELDHGVRNIKNIVIVPQIFDKKLVLGTILYGTLFSIEDKKYFSIENIHFYKGKNIEETTEHYKLESIKNMLSHELKQAFLTNNGICVGLPVIERNFESAIKTAATLTYNIYSIQNRNISTTHSTYNSILYKNINNITNDIHKYIFAVKADIQNDVYHLYVKNKLNVLQQYAIAMIPNFKTSVYMNNIFRKIKENKNLDALEESDDDDEFENIKEDKFVDLNKCVYMECSYNSKFNKYIPICITNNNNVVSIHQLVPRR